MVCIPCNIHQFYTFRSLIFFMKKKLNKKYHKRFVGKIRKGGKTQVKNTQSIQECTLKIFSKSFILGWRYWVRVLNSLIYCFNWKNIKLRIYAGKRIKIIFAG